MNDINDELNRILKKKQKEIDAQTSLILKQGKKDFFSDIKELTKEDFLKINSTQKEKVLKNKNFMRNILIIILLIVVIGFGYYKFLRGNTSVRSIEFALTTTPIGVMTKDPREYENKEVSISGIVTSSFSLGIKYYTIKDETGSIYVLTDKAVPKEGELVKVTGTFNQRFKIVDKQVETILEK